MNARAFTGTAHAREVLRLTEILIEQFELAGKLRRELVEMESQMLMYQEIAERLVVKQ